MENLKNGFSERLKAFLYEKKIKQKDAAPLLGVSIGALNRVLNAESEPSLKLIDSLLTNFPDSDIQYLVTGKASNGIQGYVGSNFDDVLNSYKAKIMELESTVRTLASMVHFPGRDLGGQPIFPKPSEANKALAKAKCNRKAGLSMFEKGSFNLPIGQA
jgi:transcriptional regulator with XRE-family HTH domain